MEETIIRDADVTVDVPREAFAPGHVEVKPTSDAIIIEQVGDALLQKIFVTASRLSSVMFDALQCHGTNVLIQNGVAAGQDDKKSCINVIPRYENDGLGLDWERKPADEESLAKSLARFQDVDRKEQDQKLVEQQKKKAEEKPQEQEIKNTEDNYLVRHLNRLP